MLYHNYYGRQRKEKKRKERQRAHEDGWIDRYTEQPPGIPSFQLN